MIGSHNSMSYLPPQRWLWRLFAPFWRCQDKTIEEQIKAGVRYFDIRVVWDRKLYSWQFAHGLVRFGWTRRDNLAVGLTPILTLLEAHGCLYRIVLERGTEYDEARFRNIIGYSNGAETWWGSHPNCIAAIIKRGWKSVRDRRFEDAYRHIQLDDRSFVPFHSDKPWWQQLSWRMLCTPRLWAKRHNAVQDGWKEDNDTVHFYDFSTKLKHK